MMMVRPMYWRIVSSSHRPVTIGVRGGGHFGPRAMEKSRFLQHRPISLARDRLRTVLLTSETIDMMNINIHVYD